MPDKQDNQTFEEKMDQLETIVNQLEQGNVSLEESMAKFKAGIQLSEQLQDTLTKAEHTMAKMMDKDGNEVEFEAPKDEKDDSDGNQAN
ncbi:exodeoxyribonuclease VII small subunit [Lentilactobacillus buchneri]|uniref:Exodeoxyribonuclease 7 small subunit n=1 Tax=Lentilactobacillus buchneri subsp. silagei CD034 TaxID=1071400 RepID=J9W1P6_LENBU|nr:exodeoxyribonuclease VII small subunit [Lentilactobacillus buchneri]MCC6100219.1 exodeoxyribonuclease VII small subunit [Lactobacillus sp.]AFS00319.1 exodeoxyribonuclease VII, small subunit [Lentilactobacillus buchneri subsp. silagei CD034]MCT2900301.1 exodeoxyribonuclease VII small subunit [Lentilactobacillus buchneri]MCT3541945.1 exodeoxyribonuclease VII small subunit [Lentilactobacillus buchneri]MCT3545062.1 exodeoxyribonuclease VII small subunit [Lentilactobacillus buchneri]